MTTKTHVLSGFSIIILLFAWSAEAWYNAQACCELAKRGNNFTVLNSSEAICGQTFTQSPNGSINEPAPRAYVSWNFCHTSCPGWGRSQGDVPTQWAAPLVQFLLPAAIFSLSTPQHLEINPSRSPVRMAIKEWSNKFQVFKISVFAPIGLLANALIVDALLIILDTLSWIILIFITAGPLLVEGLLEAVLDYRILRHVESLEAARDPTTRGQATELLLCTVSGNLQLERNEPRQKLLLALPEPPVSSDRTDPESRLKALRGRLIALMSTQLAYGGPVGAPVLFYLGSFFYNIAELLGNPSSEDAAISLAFGLEWMVLVHVAIVSGCLLASNNPSTACAIAAIPPEVLVSSVQHRLDGFNADMRSSTGATTPAANQPLLSAEPQQMQLDESQVNHIALSESHIVLPERVKSLWLKTSPEINKLIGLGPIYDTAFQPVPMRMRGRNKLRWLKTSQTWANDPSLQQRISMSKWFWLFIPTGVLILLPPIGGAFVAFATPPIGFGCRSLTFITYAAFQFLLTVQAIAQVPSDDTELWTWVKAPLDGLYWLFEPHWIFVTWLLKPVFWLIYICLLICSLFTGVGGTMLQVMGVYRTCLCYINAPYWIRLSRSPGVNLASDTEDSRHSSHNWLIAGWTAVGVMGFVCYAGWEYQKYLRRKFVTEVRRLTKDEVRIDNNREHSSSETPPARDFGGSGAMPLHTTPDGGLSSRSGYAAESSTQSLVTPS